MNDTIRILIVDDHELVRQGLVFFLSTQSTIQVVGQAENGEKAVTLAADLEPDVILMDIVMPVMDGIETCRKIKEIMPDIPILALTSYIDQNKVVDALQAGMAGYIMKDIDSAELIRAIKAASKDEIYFSPAASRMIAQNLKNEAEIDVPVSVLTEREIDVLKLLSKGENNHDIAEDLNISSKTVKTHVSKILQKLNLENRTQAALFALRNNLISLDET